jgi:hypothetical protein
VICGPTGDIQLVSKASVTNFNSSPPICGADNQIFLLFKAV